MITITTQAKLDSLAEIKKDEEVIISSPLVLNHILNVYGKLIIKKSLACDWNNKYVVAWGNSKYEAWGNSNVVARENSNVVAWENSDVVAWENSDVVARGNSNVVAWENSNVVAWENSNVVARRDSNVVAWGNSNVVAWGNSNVEARENSNVVAWGNSNVEARGNSNVVAWENSNIKVFSSYCKVNLYGFSSYQKLAENNNIINKSKFKIGIVPKVKSGIIGWLENNGIENTKSIILYKRVSKDFKTQETTKNESLWEIGKIIEHPNWNPEEKECGEGKFHACSRPYFCDEFRNLKDDIYIAIEVDKKDLYAWKSPNYPHKIAFRKGKVLCQCDKMGKKE